MNPFNNIAVYVQNERLYEKITEAAIEWDVLTDDGKNANEDNLMTVLFGHDLDAIWTDYLINKNEDGFDPKALKEVLENWAYSH